MNIEATNSTANVVEVRPRVPQPVCPSNVVHLLCSCCQKPMPKQENLPPLPGGGPYAKSQKCKLSTIVIVNHFFVFSADQ